MPICTVKVFVSATVPLLRTGYQTIPSLSNSTVSGGGTKPSVLVLCKNLFESSAEDDDDVGI